MRIHHGKHHKTYVDKLNEALAGEPALQRLTLAELLGGLAKLPEGVRTAGTAREPRGELGKAIAAQFGSFAAFRGQFTAVAARHFAGGRVALVLERAGGRLAIADLQDHDVPSRVETVPLLIVDVREYAYYVKFQNRRRGVGYL